MAKIYYHAVPVDWTREQKYQFLEKAGSIAGIEWTELTPDARGNWLRTPNDDEFGGFLVECRGVAAYGIEARPDTAAGWRVVSFERGPDDDVDAVFSQDRRSIDIEVFCNRGEPTIAEVERNELPDE